MDTLASANILTEAGFVDSQAQAVIAVMNDNLATKDDLENLRLATKDDLENLRLATQRDMKDLGTSLRNDIKNLGTSLRHEMKEMDTSLRSDIKGDIKSLGEDIQKTNIKLEYQLLLLKWMGAVSVGGVLTITAAAVTFVFQTLAT